jgi:hypothetical protein
MIMGNPMDALDKPGATSRPGFFDEGSFSCTVLGVRQQTSSDPKKPRGTEVIVVDCQVASSSNPAIKPGETRCWIVTIEPNCKKGDDAVNDVKCFMLAVLGVDPTQPAAVAAFEQTIAARTPPLKVSAIWAQMTSAANPFAGKPVNLSCRVKPTTTGGKFTIHNWQPATAPAGG